MQGVFEEASIAKTFITGGRATVTIRSKKSGDHFTYKVNKPKKGNPDARFVSVLTGGEQGYTYVGMLVNGQLRQTKGSKVAAEAPSVKAFAFMCNSLEANVIHPQLEILHEGKCGRCSRQLTHPESIKCGFGPECVGKV